MAGRLSLAIDMDEVLADTFGALRKWLNENYGYSWSDEEVQGRQLEHLISFEHRCSMRGLLERGAIYGEFAVTPDSQETLYELSKRYDIYIVTAALEYPNSIPFKFRWLREHFDFLDPMKFVFCGFKSLIKTNFLIDDNERHLKRFGGQGIVFSAHHNANLLGYPRLDCWRAAPALLSSLESVASERVAL